MFRKRQLDSQGPQDERAGYIEELEIKGNKTVWLEKKLELGLWGSGLD